MIHKIDVIEMFKLERLEAPIYIVFVALMILIWSDDIELYTIEVEEIQLPFKYINYIDIFLKEEVMKFLEFIYIKHIIPIEEDAEVLYSLIYSLFMNELQVLHEYIKSNLKKRWIHNLKSSVNALILFILKKDDSLHLYIDYQDLNQVTI
jgi:hypothetical protein